MEFVIAWSYTKSPETSRVLCQCSELSFYNAVGGSTQVTASRLVKLLIKATTNFYAVVRGYKTNGILHSKRRSFHQYST